MSGKGIEMEDSPGDAAALTEDPQHLDVDQGSPVRHLRRIRGFLIAGEEYSGPIPPPQLLKEFGELVADAPERILKAWEEEGTHRRKLEEFLLRSEYELKRNGQRSALFLVTLLSVGSIALVLTGHSVTGVAVIIGEIIGIAALFLHRESQKNYAKQARQLQVAISQLLQREASETKEPGHPETN
ncbi:MAG: DUF2335 domain-containing protein [bacterium]|nr:DUF2335 domain-containing protein [bacterium]